MSVEGNWNWKFLKRLYEESAPVRIDVHLLLGRREKVFVPHFSSHPRRRRWPRPFLVMWRDLKRCANSRAALSRLHLPAALSPPVVSTGPPSTLGRGPRGLVGQAGTSSEWSHCEPWRQAAKRGMPQYLPCNTSFCSAFVRAAGHAISKKGTSTGDLWGLRWRRASRHRMPPTGWSRRSRVVVLKGPLRWIQTPQSCA